MADRERSGQRRPHAGVVFAEQRRHAEQQLTRRRPHVDRMQQQPGARAVGRGCRDAQLVLPRSSVSVMLPSHGTPADGRLMAKRSMLPTLPRVVSGQHAADRWSTASLAVSSSTRTVTRARAGPSAANCGATWAFECQRAERHAALNHLAQSRGRRCRWRPAAVRRPAPQQRRRRRDATTPSRRGASPSLRSCAVPRPSTTADS